jgi:hypothetical protein
MAKELYDAFDIPADSEISKNPEKVTRVEIKLGDVSHMFYKDEFVKKLLADFCLIRLEEILEAWNKEGHVVAKECLHDHITDMRKRLL